MEKTQTEINSVARDNCVKDIISILTKNGNLTDERIDSLVNDLIDEYSTYETIIDSLYYCVLYELPTFDSAIINNILIFNNEIIVRTNRGLSEIYMQKVDSIMGIVSYRTIFDNIDYDEQLFFSVQEKLYYMIRRANIDKHTVHAAIDDKKELKAVYNKTLKMGELFGIRACDLLTTTFWTTEDKVQFQVPSLINYDPIMQDSVLLCYYLGENKFREFYTGYEMYIDEDSNILSSATYSKPTEASTAFSIIKRTPFVFDSKKTYIVNDQFKLQLATQDDEAITATITQMHDVARAKLDEKIANLYVHDQEIATKLNDIESRLALFKKESKRMAANLKKRS